jgi:hypothetical protein
MSKKNNKNIFRKLNFSWFRKLGKNTKLAVTLGGVLLFVGIFSVVFTRSSEPESFTSSEPDEIVEIQTADQIKATLIYTEGTVEYKTTEDSWEPAPRELEITQGTSLQAVGAVSKAVIGLEDGSEIRLDANTSIQISSMTVKRVIVKQLNGNVFSRLVPSDSRDYIVQTKNAQFQSLGTAFRTITTGDEESVEVYQNKVKEVVTNTESSAGTKLRIDKTNDGAVQARKENLNIEEIKINDFIQWNKLRDLDNDLFKDKLGFLGDFDGPSVTITNPAPSSTIKVDENQSPVITIDGKTESSAKLSVQSKSVGGSTAIEVPVSSDGTFTTPKLPASFGNSVFEFIATDSKGNKTTVNFSFRFSKQTITQEQGIALTMSETETEIKLAWGLVGLTTQDGVKIIYGKTEKPTYPNNTSIYEKTKTTTTIKKNTLSSDTTYYFRVCRYDPDQDECDVYSNSVKIDIPASETTPLE